MDSKTNAITESLHIRPACEVLCQDKRVTEGEQVHCVVAKHGFKSNTFVRIALIGMYSTRGSGSITDSYKVFDEMREKIEQHRWLLYWTAHAVEASCGLAHHNDVKRGKSSSSKSKGEEALHHGSCAEQGEKPPPPKQDYIHVRARRGQATDSHSLAERHYWVGVKDKILYQALSIVPLSFKDNFCQKCSW
ncbi:hypothetical protein RJT34_33206 [Clitoria ternatea]|uniref:Uncharacterized protein n=1 Tax=Clitoria ternatea TaxID=43366 RepID=A0AAN9I6L5_CLITE